MNFFFLAGLGLLVSFVFLIRSAQRPEITLDDVFAMLDDGFFTLLHSPGCFYSGEDREPTAILYCASGWIVYWQFDDPADEFVLGETIQFIAKQKRGAMILRYSNGEILPRSIDHALSEAHICRYVLPRERILACVRQYLPDECRQLLEW